MAGFQKKGVIHHHQRADMADFLNPDNGFRGKMKRLGQQPKDHMKENRLALRETVRTNREIKEEENQKEKELFKLPQFRDVESRLYDVEDNGADRQKNEFLMKNKSKQRYDDMMMESRAQRDELNAKMEEARFFSNAKTAPLSPRNCNVPKANEVSRLAPRSNTNFITKNRVKAQTMMPPSSSFDEQPEEGPNVQNKHASYGRVPEYLENRKAAKEEAAAELRRRAPDPDCPRGMCLMPEEERQSTLDVLMKSKSEAMKAINNLPFVVETPSQIKRQSDLESKLREIERAIGLFSKPKVYIAVDR